MTDPRAPVFKAIRDELHRLGRKLEPTAVVAGDAYLDSIGFPRAAAVPAGEPAWVTAARLSIGQREIKGAKHNPWIVRMWRKAPWFKDDETPWCGGALFDWMDQAGIAAPKEYPRAAAWADWGVPCKPQLGAVGVKRRTGGNHVFLIVGETADRIFFKALGGNQSDGVCIIDIRKSDTFAIRWPAGVPQALLPLPILPAGPIGASEA
jgi:uncharacterized protein (TIGR02594 family)